MEAWADMVDELGERRRRLLVSGPLAQRRGLLSVAGTAQHAARSGCGAQRTGSRSLLAGGGGAEGAEGGSNPLQLLLAQDPEAVTQASGTCLQAAASLPVLGGQDRHRQLRWCVHRFVSHLATLNGRMPVLAWLPACRFELKRASEDPSRDNPPPPPAHPPPQRHLIPRISLFKCTGPFMSSACPDGQVPVISEHALHQVRLRTACRPAGLAWQGCRPWQATERPFPRAGYPRSTGCMPLLQQGRTCLTSW